MHRLFGTKKPVAAAAPAPSLEETVGKMDGRVSGLDQKVCYAVDARRTGRCSCLTRVMRACVTDSSAGQGASGVSGPVEAAATRCAERREAEGDAGASTAGCSQPAAHFLKIRAILWAAQALKRKKMYEQQRDTILRQSFSVEQVCAVPLSRVIWLPMRCATSFTPMP